MEEYSVHTQEMEKNKQMPLEALGVEYQLQICAVHKSGGGAVSFHGMGGEDCLSGEKTGRIASPASLIVFS